MKNSYLDNLKIVLIALVIAHHAAQPYEYGAASWPINDPHKAHWISILTTANTTFFMGLFFLLSAYFLPGSYKRSSPGKLAIKKLVRLGIPTLFTVIFILPPFFYISLICAEGASSYSFKTFLTDWFFTDAHFTFGHTWFILQLLLYSLLYIGVKSFSDMNFKTSIALNHKTITIYTLALASTTWLVSLKYPIDSWYGYHIFEPFHIPQYLSLFCIGIIAFENKWLETCKRSIGYTWLAIGILCVIYMALHKMTGALYFSPLFYVFWSSLMCTAWCVGLLCLFRDYMHANGSLHKFLAQNGYGVYLLHILFVISMQCVLLHFALGGTVEFLATFVVSYLASYVSVGLIRKIPGVNKVL